MSSTSITPMIRRVNLICEVIPEGVCTGHGKTGRS